MTSDGASYRIDSDELVARIDLGHVLDSLTPGQGDGVRRQWRCPEPSHPDEHPSVTMSTDRQGTQRWRCWSGGHGGTAIDAVMAARGLGIGDSIRWLNDHHAHLEPAQHERSPSLAQRAASEPSPLVIEYVERCEQLLWTRSGAGIRAWLSERGLNGDVLRANRVGADPGRAYLPRRHGLPSGWPAAVFPALDQSGHITYFQARYLDPDAAGQKYTNPAQSLAANPRLAWVNPIGSTDPAGPLVVAEGIPDALIAASAGMRSVGVLGSAVPSQHVADRLAQAVTPCDDHSQSVVLCFDSDQSGRSGAARLVGLLERRGIRAANVEPPGGLDLSDWSSANDEWIDQVLGVAVRIEGDLTHPADVDEMDVDLGP